jgi:hypothetical protein
MMPKGMNEFGGEDKTDEYLVVPFPLRYCSLFLLALHIPDVTPSYPIS